MISEKELQKFGFIVVNRECNHLKDVYVKHAGLVNVHLSNYETSNRIYVILTDNDKIKNYNFDYMCDVDDTELMKMFEFVSDYLIPHFVNETEEYRLKMMGAKDTLLKNVKFGCTYKEWESVDSIDPVQEDEFSHRYYKKDFDKAIVSVKMSSILSKMYVYGVNKSNLEFIVIAIKLNDKLHNEAPKKRIDQILKLVDDVIVPYYYDGVRDYEKMTNAFNSLDFIDQLYDFF